MSDVDQAVSKPKEGALAPFDYRTAALDGLRGLAALVVVLFHADTPGFKRGYAGVDVFFVLTRFLLTSLLVRELAETGKEGARPRRPLLPSHSTPSSALPRRPRRNSDRP